MPEKQHYYVQLLGTREDWPDNMTAEEEGILSEHFAYLKSLTAQGKVLMAGPVVEKRFGLVVLSVYSEREARDIMDSEPSVIHGVHTYQMTPMRASLLASHVPEDRYVKDPTDGVLYKEVVISAPVSDVWNAWTTPERAKSFFSDNVNIELRVGGPYEIYFSMESTPGLRGSEGCRVLSFLREHMLSFEWNAPPSFGDLRYTYTRVVVFFEPLADGKTKIKFSHLGWGEGEDWDKVYAYFDKAWDFVLGNLVKRFAQ